MDDSKQAMAFISRVLQFSAECKAMDVTIDNQEIAMTILCGLPSQYDQIIVPIDAVSAEKVPEPDVVKRRLLQKEQCMINRDGIKTSRDYALVNTKHGSERKQVAPICSHCDKPHDTEPICWKKYPHLHLNSNEVRRQP